MQLRYSPTSPYARKVMVAAMEMGLCGSIEMLATNPWDADSGITSDNPLGQVPVLLLDDGQTLYDSPVICEYLDRLHQGPRLLPADGPQRWEQLRLQALADGMMDAALLIFLEHKRRAEDARSDWWLQLQRDTLDRSVMELERQAAGFPEAPGVGQIAAACALGYLDFRISDCQWRAQAPKLADWYGDFSRRSSMRATAPADPQ